MANYNELTHIFVTQKENESLKKAGIDNLKTLREQGKDSEARTILADQACLSLSKIERLVIRADLLQVNLVGPAKLTQQQALLLERLGIDGLRGLARVDLKRLENRLKQELQCPTWQSPDNEFGDMAGIKVLIAPNNVNYPYGNILEQLVNQAIELVDKEKEPPQDFTSITTHTHNLLVVSDLHIGEGWDPQSGKLNRNEDFLYDRAFAHFLVYHQNKREAARHTGGAEDRPWKLILNGDVVDFLQVTETPAHDVNELAMTVERLVGNANGLTAPPEQPDEPAEKTQERLQEIRQLLQTVDNPEKKRDAQRLIAEVDVLLARGDNAADWGMLWKTDSTDPHQLSYQDVRWGLGSIEPDNVWRMHRIYAGHPIFFQALAWFLAHKDNQIIIQTGNHDIELFWGGVRRAFRETLADAYEQLAVSEWKHLFATFGCSQVGQSPNCTDFNEAIEQRLAFTHWIYYEPGVAYIEHGTQYETANSWATYLNPRFVGILTGYKRKQKANGVGGEGRRQRLFWPWGSLIVRFIFNRVEEIHPFADQLKPISSYFTWAFSKDFLRTIGLLLLSIPGFLAVLGQIFQRGVVEGWFGTDRSITGLFNIFLRGMLTWFTWINRLLNGSWLSGLFSRNRQDAATYNPLNQLAWPVFGWTQWKLIVDHDHSNRVRLSKLIPSLHQKPKRVEECVLHQFDECMPKVNKTPCPNAPNQWPDDEQPNPPWEPGLFSSKMRCIF